MGRARLEDVTLMNEEIIRTALSSSIKAHNYPEKPFLVEKSHNPSTTVISFCGKWSVNEWFSGIDSSFGETVISKNLFPSIRSIGVNEFAKVNYAFLLRFEGILGKLKEEVKKLVKNDQQLVFAGHSSGGPMAILATIWLLEEQRKSNTTNSNPPKCVTFGSPLVGNFVISHALRREKWSSYFVHFVMRYDIVPRIHLAPLPSLQPELQTILDSLNTKSSKALESVSNGNAASTFFRTVLRNASAVTSNTACHLMGSTNPLLDTLTEFVKFSPYRPFGTYVFCTESGKLILVNNPDAVLQILFFSCQLNSEGECDQVAYKSLKDHWGYDSKLQGNLEALHSIRLDDLDKLPLSFTCRNIQIAEVLDELGLSKAAILNLRATGVYEKQKMKNEEAIEGKKEYIKNRLTWLEEVYIAVCRVDSLGYYDAFKLQKDKKDFEANLRRYELIGVMDEIKEMLQRYELPDEFEGNDEWIQLGTRFRRVVEPLDIANYYRNLKNDDTGPYLNKGRPRRYKFTQRWLEHSRKMIESAEESSLWAEVEELCIQTKAGLYVENESRIMKLEKKMKRWINEIGDDMLLKKSTFMEWWKTLPYASIPFPRTHLLCNSKKVEFNILRGKFNVRALAMASNNLSFIPKTSFLVVSNIKRPIKSMSKQIMAPSRLENVAGIHEDVIKTALSSAIKAHSHKYSKRPFLVRKSSGSSIVVISFPGSWSVNEWCSGVDSSFGETEISRELFPSIKSIGVDQYAKVNDAFFKRFKGILEELEKEVINYLKDDKQLVFTGHSSGGPIASLATIWLLEKQRKSNTTNSNPPKCVTFGSPLVGDFIFPHALRREKWSSYFVHFVMRYDIVPRIHLAPLPSLQQELPTILESFNPKSLKTIESVSNGNEASTFFMTVVRNASAVTSNSACRLMGNMNLLSDTLTNFVELSPYRPFGTYIFCTETGKLVVVTNPDAVLQLLFFSCQLGSESERAQVASKSLKDHWGYESKMQQNMELLHPIRLDELDKLPLSLVERNTPITEALIELGLSTRAILNLRAAGAYEELKKKNQEEIEGKKEYIKDRLTWIEKEYRDVCVVDGLGYYDAFRLQNDPKDFEANIKRLELAGVWDEIVEMLKRYELPDEFESIEEWIELGTTFRRRVELLDIANFYRHLKNDISGPYMLGKGRPKRYKFTQKWLEHGHKMIESSDESSLWAEVEELRIATKTGLYAENERKIMELEKKIKRWIEEIGDDILLKKSSFMEWWKTLPENHRSQSCIKVDIERVENGKNGGETQTSDA